MLEKVDLNRKMGKKEYKEWMDDLQPKLSYLQRACKEQKIPVMIVFEGFGAAGKGTLINKIIEPLDPRGFSVYATAVETKEEKMHPFLWRFWTKIPSQGRIAIFDRSWYRRVLVDRFDGITTKEQLDYAFGEICSFEKQLTDDGMVIIKLFADVSKKEQKKRFDKLLEDKKTAWRVTKDDLARNKHYEEYLAMNEEMLEKTDSEYAPWHILECTDREYAAAKMTEIVVSVLEQAIADKKAEQEKREQEKTRVSVYISTCIRNIELNAIAHTEVGAVLPSDGKFPTLRLQVTVIGLGSRNTQCSGQLYRRTYHIVRITDISIE